MSLPRILPVVGLAIGGVMAVNALAGAGQLPELLSGARAFAEEAVGQTKVANGAPDAASAATPAVAAAKPAPVCAPTAAELAKAAGLSPAELRILQNLGERRGQLDQREQDFSTQIALLAAAEAKLDAKLKAMNTVKGEVQNLLKAGDAKQEAEVARMTKVFESMKPKNAAERMVVLDDAVRLPIAARMKERSLSAILAQMPPDEAKRLTESLARRFAALQSLAAAANAPAAATPAAAREPQQQAKAEAPPAKPVAKAPPRKAPAPTKMAAAAPKKPAPKPAAEPEPQLPGKPQPYTPPTPAAATPDAKAG